MIGALTLIATAALAQEPKVYAPHPPALVQSGTFSCRIIDQSDHQSTIEGELTNARSTADGTNVADLRIGRPDGHGAPLNLIVPLKPFELELSGYDSASNLTILGSLGIRSSNISTITLELTAPMSPAKLYVGFCKTQFSRTARKVTP